MKLFDAIATAAVIGFSVACIDTAVANEICSVDGQDSPCEVTSRGGSHNLKWMNTGKSYIFTIMPGHGGWQQGAVKVTEPTGRTNYGSYVHEGSMRGGTYIVQYKGSTIVFKGW